MDIIIQKYDYANSTDETHKALQDDLNNVKATKLAEDLNLAALKNIINIFIQKICIKQYVQNVPRFSPGTWMATITYRDIAAIMRECIETGRISENDCHDCLFDLLLAMIRVGPGTSHLEVIVKLNDTANMKEYLKNLKGEKLWQMVTALKSYTYIPERDLPLKDYTRLIGENMSRLLKSVFEKRGDLKELDIWTAALDLHSFYLQHTNDVPDDIHNILESCRMTFFHIYNRNPYKEYPDIKLLQQHIQIIESFVSTADFPRGGQLRMATDFVHFFTNLEGDKVEAVWPELMSLWKSISLLDNARDLSDMIEKIKYLFDRINAKTIQENRVIFETWAVSAIEIFKRSKNKMVVAEILPRMISDMDKKYIPAKGDEKYWYPLLKGLLSIPTKDTLYAVKDTLRESKFKRMWNWKQNIHEAKEMIQIVEKLNLPTKEGKDYWYVRNCNDYCGDAIKELIKMLKIQKLEHQIMAEVGRMTMTHMEERSVFTNSMVHCYLGEIDFKKVTEVVPEITRRFEPLITNTDYPWLDGWCLGNGLRIFQNIVGAYNSGSEIPDEINQSLLRILHFCMEDERELINIENGNPTVWGALLQSSIIFVVKHCESGTANVCLPFLNEILKFRYAEEKKMQDICSNTFLLVGQKCPAVCAPMFDSLLDWYIEEPSSNLMQVFWSIGNTVPDVLSDKLDNLIEVSKDHTETYSIQAIMFYTLSMKRPEMFTEKVVDILMEYHFHTQQIRIQILTVTANVTKENPQFFVKHMEKLLNDKSIQPMEQHFVNGTLINVATKFVKYKEPVFNYLLNVLKAAIDESQLSVTITGLKDICVKYGSEIFNPHQNYLLERRDKEQNINIKEQFTHLINYIEGRSLETVAKDVKETQDDVEQLDTRVTGNETAIGTLTVKVEEHDEEIQELSESVDIVTKRVDFAEKDIEEANVKIEEIDKKTMTNAPKWSRDLTKLMNPTDEHDWRLLAQRLGYSNDDIRAWASQHDPCMSVLSEWYATHKTREATYAVLTALQEMNRADGASIVENAMKATEDVVEDEEFEYKNPPAVFLSYQWGHQDEVKLLRNHLQMAGYECWMDIGQMGGGDKLFEKIDNGIRGAKVVICCVSEKYAKSPNCNREVNLSVSLNKPIIPLLLEKMAWPPQGSMGPIFSEYLFIRFFQRAGEETNDDRIWPIGKFQEMLMQLNCYGIKPEESSIADRYKNWWIPVQEIIIVDKSKKSTNMSQANQKEQKLEKEKKSPDVFISYQWGKQKQIIALYQRLTGLGLSCWMDIHQMGGGDSLYEKIDSGVRGCKVVLTCITQKYSLSANCRREVSLADALKKPIIPLLLEKMDWPPTGPMSMVFTQLLFINVYRDEHIQLTWKGQKFDELANKIEEHVPFIMAGNTNKNNSNSDNREMESDESKKDDRKTEPDKTNKADNKDLKVDGANTNMEDNKEIENENTDGNISKIKEKENDEIYPPTVRDKENTPHETNTPVVTSSNNHDEIPKKENIVKPVIPQNETVECVSSSHQPQTTNLINDNKDRKNTESKQPETKKSKSCIIL